ncbi:MAG TPA: hypothetical protein VG797_06785 [Phycisphaerales bacterium]|nr:hypothetical protein [Phycisphaerales bacterium]
MRSVFVLAVGFVAAPGFASLINGDFEAGNTGFTSQYQYVTVSVPPNEGQYGVTHSSLEWSNFWNTVNNDHTTGSGQFLIVDTVADLTMWSETVDVAPNTAYTFGAWLATWTLGFQPAQVALEIDGQLITTWTGPAPTAWTQYSAAWTSGAASTATIRLYSPVHIQPGGDIAIDDITLTAVPAPGALALAVFAPLVGRRRR